MTITDFRAYVKAKAQEAGGVKTFARLAKVSPNTVHDTMNRTRKPNPKIVAYLGFELHYMPR